MEWALDQMRERVAKYNKRRKSSNDNNKKIDEPMSFDYKTSFEKDYKKPKPEDDINAGLYGKIEL